MLPGERPVKPLAAYFRSLDPRLPRDVWILQAGGLVNTFGNGVVLPFLIIYLHNVRGISLGVAGLAAATNSACALSSGFLAGSLGDRIGPRRVLVGGLLVMAFAVLLFPLIRTGWHALLLYGLMGVGSGSFWPSQSMLLTSLTRTDKRHSAYALQRVAMNLGLAVGGLTGGLIATTSDPGSFTVLFVLDAVTFFGYIAALIWVREPARDADAPRGTVVDVVRNRVFMRYIALNALFMGASVAIWTELLPPFAKNSAHVSETGVGVIWLVDALVVVVAQMPLARLVEGHRRMRMLAVMGVGFSASMLAYGAIGAWTTAVVATVLMALATVVFAVGQCLHGAINAPLAADLAPPGLVGRYMAFTSQSWQIGWIVGPAAGGFVLQHHPLALWPLAAAANLAGAAAALALERTLPRRVLRTPRPEPTAASVAAGPAG
jgi:MFS family permease